MQHNIVATAIELPLALIIPGDNDRTQFPQAHIERLAASIASEGLHQPITVRPISGGLYQIVAGECRYRACKHLNRATIPAIVKEMTDQAASLAMLSENIQRRNLDPMDEALAFRKRADEFAMTPDAIASWANVSADLVRRRLALLDLIPDIQQQIRAGSLPLGHAEAMAGLDRNNQIAAIAALTNANGAMPTVKVFRKLCGELLEKQSSMAMFDLESLWREKLAEAESVKEDKKAARLDAERLARELAEAKAERERLARELAEANAERERLECEKEAFALFRRLSQAMKDCKDESRVERLTYLINRAQRRYERRAW